MSRPRLSKPVKLTADMAERIIESVKHGTPWRDAIMAEGVPENLAVAWYERGREAKSNKFFRLYRDIGIAQAEARRRKLLQIDEAAEKGDGLAAMWWLKNYGDDG